MRLLKQRVLFTCSQMWGTVTNTFLQKSGNTPTYRALCFKVCVTLVSLIRPWHKLAPPQNDMLCVSYEKTRWIIHRGFGKWGWLQELNDLILVTVSQQILPATFCLFFTLIDLIGTSPSWIKQLEFRRVWRMNAFTPVTPPKVSLRLIPPVLRLSPHGVSARCRKIKKSSSASIYNAHRGQHLHVNQRRVSPTPSQSWYQVIDSAGMKDLVGLGRVEQPGVPLY
jgi:hypothetical protein